MFTRLLLILLFFFIAAPHGATQDGIAQRLSNSFDLTRPMLRAHVVVSSGLVTLGDLFDHSGRLAETPVFRAPAPGTRGSVPAYMVLESARDAGLTNIDLAGLSEVTVERAGATLNTSDLIGLVEDALQRRLDQQFGQSAGNYQLTILNAPSALTVGVEQVDQLVVDLLTAPTNRSSAFSATIRSPLGNVLARIDGRAEHQIAVPVLSRAVSRGEVILQSDVRLQNVAYASTIGAPTLTAASEIVGQAANRSLRAGAPLSPEDITDPLMVERQDLVTLVYRHGALALTVRARAMDEGAQGQSIDVMNLQSNQIVRGVVAGHRLVHVLVPMQEVASTSLQSSTPLTSANAERIQ